MRSVFPTCPARPAPGLSRPVLALVVACLPALSACNDGPGAAAAPGNVIVNDSHQDAVAYLTQDVAVIPPMGAMDGGYPDGGAYLDAVAGSTGYADVQSPQSACSSCTCSNHRGFCLENGVTTTAMGAGPPPPPGVCPLATFGTLAIGCNPLPIKCAGNVTCECLLDTIQPPLGCYPECTIALGYIDVFCANP